MARGAPSFVIGDGGVGVGGAWGWRGASLLCDRRRRSGCGWGLGNTSANQIEKTASTAIKTFGIKVAKLDDQNQPLDGAEFTIYSDSNHTTAVDCYGPAGGTVQENPQTTITTNSTYEQGTAYCKGLKAGTYYLVETKPPIGYVAAAETTITLNESSATDGVTGVTGASTGFYTATVSNNKNIFALPFTGGRGVIIYAIVGVSIVSVASVYYYRKKKQQA